MKITLIGLYESKGLRILSSCLKEVGQNVKLVFIPKPFNQKYSKNELDFLVELLRDCDLLGLSLLTNFFDNAVQITKHVKSALKLPIVWGGVHPTIRPEECLNFADAVCIGEGEISFVEFCNKLDRNQDYYDTQGFLIKKDGHIIKNALRPLINDLDTVPFPDYHYENHFIIDSKGVSQFNHSLLEKFIGRGYTAIATRGCRFGCTYCINNFINKMNHSCLVRKRSIDNVIEELVFIKRTLPFINRIKFDDDAFFEYSTDDIRYFCAEYKEHIGLPLTITGVHPLTLKREKLSPLVEAGLNSIRMGIQSASADTKKLYKRNFANQKILDGAKLINEFKDRIKRIQYDIILDNPFENDDSLVETLLFLSYLPTPYLLSLNSLTFFPATELYDKAKVASYIKDDYEEVYRKYMHGWKKTYLNKIVALIGKYAKIDHRINASILSFMTKDKVRKYKIGHLVYFALYFYLILLKGKRNIKNLRLRKRISGVI